ncbi:hypothetical protein CP985_00305 [Malaciobacter mytili LMG 24559]|uniref:Methyltransferase n=1 Tax=Malaciobacter mytili LMG 24559 TaxID=1032238 RepID=A0AAX2AL05_9BACT|nr:hypothetical protein [Malaciobacter mytili]AXH16186.1 hypothetical protein AMYT_2654 [Malaciobacter mytili LMG 24559]RXK17085.1 hypothetical protein CP985_00305 [Malaciobacter mytili LMG 24559]
MKFYDTGFITKYQDFTQVQIFTAGKSILNLKLYKQQVCSDTFSCLDYKSFNKQYLSSSYNEKFIKELFEKEDNEINFKDRKNAILIKVKRN